MSRFGIWDGVTKRFVFGISEPTKREALRAFDRVAGRASYAWRYEVKKIPIDWDNPKNPRYKRR